MRQRNDQENEDITADQAQQQYNINFKNSSGPPKFKNEKKKMEQEKESDYEILSPSTPLKKADEEQKKPVDEGANHRVNKRNNRGRGGNNNQNRGPRDENQAQGERQVVD